jgi:hypothetical protein
MNESKNKKCDNFQTKFAFIRNKNITIDDYIKKYVNNNKKGKILCKNIGGNLDLKSTLIGILFDISIFLIFNF